MQCHNKKFSPSNRSNRRATGANAGLINENVICYSNAIFLCIASCAYLDNFLTSCGVHQMKSIDISTSIMSLDLWLVPSSVVEWVILIPASLLNFTKNVMLISTRMKVNGMTTALNNEYIFKICF
jgi:hypothetical protein